MRHIAVPNEPQLHAARRPRFAAAALSMSCGGSDLRSSIPIPRRQAYWGSWQLVWREYRSSSTRCMDLTFMSTCRPAARRFFILTEKIAARCSDVILSQNNEDIQTAIHEGIARPEQIRHLGNGIDLVLLRSQRISDMNVRRETKEEQGLSPKRPVVGFVGRLAARRKGFLDFLAAGAHVVERIPRRAAFLLIGEADAGKPDAVDPSAAVRLRYRRSPHLSGDSAPTMSCRSCTA